MSKHDEVPGKVIDFLKHAKRREARQGNVTVQNSNGVIIGDHSTITQVITPKVVNKTIVKRERDDGFITVKQAAKLRDLVHEIVELESRLKKRPRRYGAVYNDLFKKFEVTKRDLIPIESFNAAEKYLRNQIGRLRGMPSAKKKLPDWRRKKYAFIHIQCKKYDLTGRMRDHLREKHQAESLTELNDSDLDRLSGLVSSWVKRLK